MPHSNDPTPGDKPKPPPSSRSENFKNLAIGISSVITALVIPILGYIFANQGKERETQSKFVELALGILKESPTAEKEDVRKWATSIVDKYSGVPLNAKTQLSLVNSLSLPSSVTSTPDSNYVQGVDLYHGDTISLSSVPKNAIRFVILKATQGSKTVDATFPKRWNDAKAAGFVRGAYHYLTYEQDAAEQADLYLKCAGLGSGDMPPILDLEGSVSGGTPTPEKIRQVALAWLGTVQKATNVIPIIYTTRAFADMNLNEEFSQYRLWFPRYQSSLTKAMLPRVWSDWFIWQYTNSGSIPGIEGRYELNRFNGSEDELRKSLIP